MQNSRIETVEGRQFDRLTQQLICSQFRPNKWQELAFVGSHCKTSHCHHASFKNTTDQMNLGPDRWCYLIIGQRDCGLAGFAIKRLRNHRHYDIIMGFGPIGHSFHRLNGWFGMPMNPNEHIVHKPPKILR